MLVTISPLILPQLLTCGTQAIIPCNTSLYNPLILTVTQLFACGTVLVKIAPLRMRIISL